MWAKNVLFAAMVLSGIALLTGSVVPIGPTEHRQTVRLDRGSIRQAVSQVDTAIATAWREASVAPAPPADDLQVARRMSLALVGSIPSLEDIRHLESLPADRRLDTWLAELLADRRSADYLAERLARALCRRRRRSVPALSPSPLCELAGGRVGRESPRIARSCESSSPKMACGPTRPPSTS